MPKDESIWNPYRMVPVKEGIKRMPPLTDEKFKGKSGTISCSLQNLTSLFVGKNRVNSQQFLTRCGRYVIPASSLKGMLRSLAEIVGGGCFVTDPKGQYAAEYAACNKVHSLCIACRMFGMMERGSGARVHKGSICFSDAFVREGDLNTQSFEILLSNCGTRHEPFYRNPLTGKLDGKCRKLYFHQPKRKDSVLPIPDNLRSRAWKINALLPGHYFDFEVHFSNLRQEELELLIYVLALEDDVTVKIEEGNHTLKGPLRHKIGNAKPLGMGSCHISIGKITYFSDPATRFESLHEVGNTVYEGDALKDEIAKMTREFARDKSLTMQYLRKMMVWDENDPRDFKYQDYDWFQDTTNSQKVLKMI